MTLYNGVALVNLDNDGLWLFPLFPRQINKEDRSNWSALDVTVGVKPLMFSNIEPQRIAIEEAWLDSDGTGDSVLGQVDGLRALMRPTELDPSTGIDSGTPPLLRLIYGDFQKTVVLEELRVEETLFDLDGSPTRARMSMVFLEFARLERVTQNIVEVDENGNPI